MLDSTDTLFLEVDAVASKLDRARVLLEQEQYEEALVTLNALTHRQADLSQKIWERMANAREMTAARMAYIASIETQS